MDTLIKNARVLTLDQNDREYDSADIHIRDGRIHTLGPGIGAGLDLAQTKVIEARGLLAMPGLVNAHLHSPGNFTRGALDDTPLEVFMLYEVPPLSQKPPSPRLNYVRTLLGAIEMLKLGITSVLDDAFYIPVPTPETIDGLMQAYADSGMRAAVSLDQPNVVEYDKYPYLRDLLPERVRGEMESAPRQTTAALAELYRYFIQRWHGSGAGRLMAAVSCSASQRVTIDYSPNCRRSASATI
ncbi:MAG: amidohydrolase family protein [Gammaproteobacteria bacterium]